MSTSLRQAFQIARHPAVTDPQERLLAIGTAAWGRYQKPISHEARVEYVRSRLVHENAFTLIEQWRPNAMRDCIDRLLQRAADIIARERPGDAGEPAAGEGQAAHDNRDHTVLSSTDLPDAGQPADSGGPARRDFHMSNVPAVPPSPDPGRSHAVPGGEPAIGHTAPLSRSPARPTLTELADLQAARGASRAAFLVELSRLDTIKIGDKPLGDCTVKEVREWIETREFDRRAAGRDIRFASALVSNLPSGAIIREYWPKAAEVETQYLKAEAENAA